MLLIPNRSSSRSINVKSTSVSVLLLGFCILSFAGCTGSSTTSFGFDDQIEPGPVKLRNLEQLKSYLSGHSRGGDSWRKKSRVKKETTAEVVWNFQSNGDFYTWISFYDSKQSPPENFFSQTTGLKVDPDSEVVQGKYRVTLKSIHLTEMRTAKGKKLKDQSVPIHWVDGKLRIGINDQQLMRVIPKAATPPKTILKKFKS